MGCVWAADRGSKSTSRSAAEWSGFAGSRIQVKALFLACAPGPVLSLEPERTEQPGLMRHHVFLL